MTCPENRVFSKVTSSNEVIRVLIHCDWHPYKKREIGHRHVPGRRPHEDGDDASTSQGMPEISGNHWKLRERHGTDFPSPPPEEINPADNSDVGLLAFRTARGYPSVV